jgi:DNA invertase Pin-like site-specific DNA recombinase
MIYGYARVSTDGQSVGAQVRQLTKAGCKALEQIDAGDVLLHDLISMAS